MDDLEPVLSGNGKAFSVDEEVFVVLDIPDTASRPIASLIGQSAFDRVPPMLSIGELHDQEETGDRECHDERPYIGPQDELVELLHLLGLDKDPCKNRAWKDSYAPMVCRKSSTWLSHRY